MPSCRFKGLKKECRQQSPGAILKVMASTVGYMENGQEFLRSYSASQKTRVTEVAEKGVITHGSGEEATDCINPSSFVTNE